MKRLFIIILVFVFILGGCGFEPEEDSAAYAQISMEEAISLMENETGFIILDVRTQAEYDEGHIPGALCLPNESIADTPPGLLPDKEQLILVYCRSGNRSKQASSKLAQMGYTNIHEFGGIIDWPGEIEK